VVQHLLLRGVLDRKAATVAFSSTWPELFRGRGVQVPAAAVRAGVRVRALLQHRPGRGEVRRHPQGVRRQQRLQAALPPPRRRPLRGRRHHHLRGAGQAPRPGLRMRRPDLRAPAAGGLLIAFCLPLSLSLVFFHASYIMPSTFPDL
jgi:hypothetical protein